MSDDESKILFSSYDNGQDGLYDSKFNLNGNSSLGEDDPKNNIHTIINEDNLTNINNPSEISSDLKEPQSNSDSQFISKKTKRPKNNNADKIIKELDNNSKEISVKNSIDLIDNSKSSEIILKETEKSDKKEITKIKINKEVKALLQKNYDCFLEGFKKIKNFKTFLDIPFSFLPVIYKIDSNIEIPNSLVERTPKEFIEEILIYKKQKEKNKNENIKKKKTKRKK